MTIEFKTNRLYRIGTKLKRSFTKGPYCLEVDGDLETILGSTFPKDYNGNLMEVVGIEMRGDDVFLHLSYHINRWENEGATLRVKDVAESVVIWAISKAFEAGRKAQEKEDRATALDALLS